MGYEILPVPTEGTSENIWEDFHYEEIYSM